MNKMIEYKTLDLVSVQSSSASF